MSLLERIGNVFGSRRHEDAEEPRVSPRQAASTAPRAALNDALAYGVAIMPVTASPGAWYWQAVRVHHLSPEENNGNHHIYVDLYDSATGGGPAGYGKRVFGGRARVTWDGGEQLVTVEKPVGEPGTNFPMWKWQVCAAEALGLPGAELPSDRVTGMHTGHPDEATGNTLFHHSFGVTFVRVRAPEAVYTDSVIYGRVHRAAGRTALLLSDDSLVASQVIGADETFRFTDLGAGNYAVGVDGTEFRSPVTHVSGQDQVQLDLTWLPAGSVLAGHVRNGTGRVVLLTRDGAEVATQAVAPDETYRFEGLAEGAYRVLVSGAPAISPVILLDGLNEAAADLVAPLSGKPLVHYVLFGPPDQPATRVNLLLAQDYLLAFGPSFGFHVEAARCASQVTIIADPSGVSAETEADLAAGGSVVQRIAGSVAEVSAGLAARVTRDQPF